MVTVFWLSTSQTIGGTVKQELPQVLNGVREAIKASAGGIAAVDMKGHQQRESTSIPYYRSKEEVGITYLSNQKPRVIQAMPRR